jgi:hypothetical protein
MPLKLYDTRELVPEALRATAIETKDSKFAVEEVDPTLGEAGKRALEAERERADTAEKARKAAEKKAADLEREKEARAKGISEEELTKIREAEALARKPIEAERDAALVENRKLKLTDRVQALALKHGVMADRLDDAMLVIEKRTDLGDAGGIVYKDKDGKVTADDAPTFFTKLKAEKGWFFAGSGASGSSATGSHGSGGDATPDEKAKIAADKRAQVIGAF